MNIEYLERNSSVLVTDEFGCKSVKDNCSNIKEILINENKSEVVHNLLQEYYSLNRNKIEPVLSLAKTWKFSFLGGSSLILIGFILFSLLTGINFVSSLSKIIGVLSNSFHIFAVYGAAGIVGLFLEKHYMKKYNDIQEIIADLENEQINLRNEKYNLERQKNVVKKQSNNVINMFSVSLKDELDSYCLEMEDKVENKMNDSKQKFKPKTLSRVRK